MNNEIYIHIDKISKSYGNVLALDQVSLDIKKNELFGFIGPDGAGKTSLFRILTTLILPNSGTAVIDGYDTVKDYKMLRKNIGYMPGKFSLYQDLTVEENLNFFASVFGAKLKDNYYLIESIYKHLEPFKKRRAAKLSGGMKQKLALCCALIHKPDLLVLDEPTTGVDAVSRYEFWIMLKNLRDNGITILVSTPYMDEASLCDRVALMQNGRIMTVDTPQGIVGDYPYKLFAAKSIHKSDLISLLENDPRIRSAFAFGETIHITLSDEKLPIEQLENDLKLKIADVTIQATEANIEDCFLMMGTDNDK
jgi:ABC-type multidrug transport system ATPase subunit